MTLEDAVRRFEAILAAKAARLGDEIRRMIVERPFVLDEGVPRDHVDGVHFEYDWDTFVPHACPLNTETGYCGAAERLALLDSGEKRLLPAGLEDQVLATASGSDRDVLEDALSEALTRTYVDWFMKGWRRARGASPGTGGFLSVHDTLWRLDLDTGEEFREDDGRVRFSNSP